MRRRWSHTAALEEKGLASKGAFELASADPEAGKFSFRAADAIKEHVGQIENEAQSVSESYVRGQRTS